MNKNTSTSNMLLGLKTLDRDRVNAELATVDVVNCADSTRRVLKKAGIELPPRTFLPIQPPHR